jgi:hypothetical protein
MVQRGTIEQPAVDDYRRDLLCVVNVVERVCTEQNQISNLARFH